VVANEIHIPVGKALALRLDSADVLHEFWVPELARKIKTVPGHPNHIWIQADKPGTYLGFCSEFCGTQHAWMHFLLVTDPQAEFQQWEQAQRAVLFRSLRRGAGIVVQNVSESSATLIAGFS